VVITFERYGRMGGRRDGRRERVRGEYGFVESLTHLSQRLNARGGEGEGKRGVWVCRVFDSIEPEAQRARR
jgi:hypothetical protein